MKTKAIIVDDEEMSQLNLGLLLEENCKNIEVYGCAANITDALQIIDSEEPDLIFLDIQLQGNSGFDLLDQCKNRDFEVIFITAYNEYALRALKQQAIDYVLKPIDRIELAAAVEKAIDKIKLKDTAMLLEEVTRKNRKKDF